MNKLKRIFLVMLTIVLVSVSFPPGPAYAKDTSDIVLFGSKLIEAEVRKAIDKPVGDISRSEVQGITAITLTSAADSARFGQHIDLTGLELLPGLTALNINIMDFCTIKNIEVLRKLPNLTVFRMQQLQPTYYTFRNLDIISNLKNLKELSLINFKGVDITELGEFSKLQKLSLSYCGIKDIHPLSKLPALEEVNLTGNDIEDISPLQQLNKITSLYLDGNLIKSYTAIYDNYKNYLSKDFILKKDTSGNVVKKDIENTDKVTFGYRETEAMLRILLNRPTGCLTQAELDSIKSLEMSIYFSPYLDDYMHIYDLQDLSKLTNLESLNIQFGKSAIYANLGALGKLTKLAKLSFSPYSDGLEDISDFGTLVNLKELNVPFPASEENLNTVKKLTKLERLKWPGTDLKPLIGFNNLKELTVPSDALDFSVLSKLPQLSILHIEGYTAKNLASLKGCTNIKNLDIFNLPLSDISFLSNMTGLEKLQLGYGGLRSIKSLSTLCNLRELNLSNNEISDLTPLAQLKKLEILNLENNKISMLSSLKSLTQLRELDLSANIVKDISVLNQLKALEVLDLSNNYVNGLKPLEGLTAMKNLSLFSCGISDVSSLAAMTGMETLYIGSNSIKDISSLKEMTQMKLLYGSLNKIEDISALRAMKQLSKLNICYNKISDITPLGDLYNLEELDLRFNTFTDASPILKMTRMEELMLDGSPITDYTSLQAFKNATKADITGLNRPGYVFGDAVKTDTAAYWNGNAIPCIKMGESYAIALEDLNSCGYDATWQKVKGDDTARWRIKRNSTKPIQTLNIVINPDENGSPLGKAMYSINYGIWENRQITIVGVDSTAYIMVSELEARGFDVVFDKDKNVLNISLWNKQAGY